MPDVKDMAARLIQAEWDRATIAPFSDADPGIDIEAAYAAQWAFVQSKLDAGYKLIGVKPGLTSRAKQEAMGVTEPLYGWITSGMIAGAGQPVDRHSLIQPRGAGDRIPAGPERHRARDRHQRAGRHQRPSSPRWISSTPGTATTVHLAGRHRRQRQRGTGRARPPGPPARRPGRPAAGRLRAASGGTVAATAAGAVMAAPGSCGGLAAGQLPRPTR